MFRYIPAATLLIIDHNVTTSILFLLEVCKEEVGTFVRRELKLGENSADSLIVAKLIGQLDLYKLQSRQER